MSSVALREFYEGDEDTADYHKYSEDSSSLILPKDYLISFSGSSGTSTFKLPKHELVSNQKITFNGGRITYADYYYETASWNSDWINGASFNGAITSSVNISSGETFLVYDTGLEQYFLYQCIQI